MTNCEAYENYIIDCIDLSGYELDHLNSVSERVNALHEIFMAEYGWHIARSGSVTKTLKEWLSGLPSSITLAFYNGDILDLAVSFGTLPKAASERMQDKILAQYWQFMAIRLNGLFTQFVKV